MSQSLAKILLHTVFSTKERAPFFRDNALREELHRYLGGILNNLDCLPIIVGGAEDHIHMLSTLSRTCNAAEIVKESKRGSSLWLKTKSPALLKFRMAEWLRNILDWIFANGGGAKLYRGRGRTPPKDLISGRISSIASTVWN